MTIYYYLKIYSVPSEGQTVDICRYIHGITNGIGFYFSFFNKVEVCLES